MSKRILIAAGGTGGHLFPAQSFAEELQDIKKEYQISFAGTGLSSNPYFHKGYPFFEIISKTPFGKNPICALFFVLKGFLQGIRLLRKIRPHLIIGFGSYHSFPILAASFILRIPYILYESNVMPGKVIKAFSSNALFTAHSFEETKKHLKGKTQLVEMPLWSLRAKKSYDKQQAREGYGLKKDLFTILIFGGSQGAKAINLCFKEALEELRQKIEFQVIHFIGRTGDQTSIEEAYVRKNLPAFVCSFEKDMAKAWSACDLVICRAGSSTINEILLFQVKSILIPLAKAADNHQLANARLAEELAGAITIEEKDLSAHLLTEVILKCEQELKQKGVKKIEKDKKPSLATLVHHLLEKLSYGK